MTSEESKLIIDKLTSWLSHYCDCPMPDDYTCEYKSGTHCDGSVEKAKDCWIKAAKEDIK